MKMTKQDQAMLHAAIEKHGVFKVLPSLNMKENQSAQAWRIFHYCNKLESYALSDKFYTYLNDSHIQTALMKILYSKGA